MSVPAGSDTTTPLDDGSMQKFPAFEGKDLDGNPVKSDDLFSGNAVTVVNFWFTTCNPCVGELAELDALNKELAEKGGALIGVNTFTLDGDKAPITVANYLKLAKDGFYDGLTFHRIIDGFMIQGGCPEGTGMGGPGYSIKGEFAQNGVKNDLVHTEGVLSMARAMHPNSGGSQFFIMHKASPHLDGSYAAFGKVTEGMDVVNKIADVQTDYSDRPLQEQKIKSMTVETFGVDYPEPEKC